MKLSGRESIMVIFLVFMLLFLGYYFFALSPAQDGLVEKQDELVALQAQDQQNAAIVDASSDLGNSISTVKDEISTLENKLIPSINSEVICQYLEKTFEENGFTCVVELLNDPVVEEVSVSPDGTYSDNKLDIVSMSIKVSGTDGVTAYISNTGASSTAVISYPEFIRAVKTVEGDSTDVESVKITSVSMESDDQGFQYFTLKINVYAYDLVNRLSEIDAATNFYAWAGDADIVAGGNVGPSALNVPESLFNTTYYRPFAENPVVGGTSSSTPQDTTEGAG